MDIFDSRQNHGHGLPHSPIAFDTDSLPHHNNPAVDGTGVLESPVSDAPRSPARPSHHTSPAAHPQSRRSAAHAQAELSSPCAYIDTLDSSPCQLKGEILALSKQPSLIAHSYFDSCDHDPAESSEPSDSDHLRISGRKASRSLRIFRNMQCYPHQLQLPRDLRPISLHLDTETILSALSAPSSLPGLVLLANLDHMSILEPVLLATYFPHNPVEVARSDGEADLSAAPAADPHPQPKHMAADVEFDCLVDGRIKLTNVDHHYESKLPAASRPRTPVIEARAPVPSSPRFPLSVELRPFANKVGGHTAIFSFLKRAVCKALVNLENVFYETVEVQHPELLEFMPKYIGVLNVRYSSMVPDIEHARAESDSQVHRKYPSKPCHDPHNAHEALAPGTPAQSPSKSTATSPATSPAKSSAKFDRHCRPLPHSSAHLLHSGYLPEVVLDDNTHIIPSSLLRQFYTVDDEDGKDLHARADTGHVGSTLVNTHLQEEIMQEVFRPWQSKAGGGPARAAPPLASALCKHTRFEQYILLEDLTSNMQRPCVLDLKMGTRQYGVDALPKKQELQRRKCAATTSRLLGVRVCGLQIFQKNRAEPINKNKYFGRRVRAGAQFCRILALYLYDGHSAMLVLAKVVPLVRRLRRLHKVCLALTGYRLYGLLVLLMHDAACEGSPDVKVKIIDFARLAVPGHSDQGAIAPAHPAAADQGYLRGLLTLITYFETIFLIVSGHELAQVGDAPRFLHDHAQKYAASNVWLDRLSAVEYGEAVDTDTAETGDPFERHYHYDFPDVEVSE